MDRDITIRFLGIEMRRSTYKIAQCVCISLCAALAVVSYVFLHDFEPWFLRYAWLIFVCVGIAEVGEAVYVLNKNKP